MATTEKIKLAEFSASDEVMEAIHWDTETTMVAMAVTGDTILPTITTTD